MPPEKEAGEIEKMEKKKLTKGQGVKEIGRCFEVDMEGRKMRGEKNKERR
jgi:hypothetical protein